MTDATLFDPEVGRTDEEVDRIADAAPPEPPLPEMFDPAKDDAEAVFDRNGVRRSKDGRPYVKSPCPNAYKPGDDPWRDDFCRDGRVPGKRAGTTKQCPKCKGAGEKEVLYTRCTSFVGALEDRQNLETWKIRTALLGVAADHRARVQYRLDDDRIEADALLARLLRTDLDDREALDALADEAFALGDGYEKAAKGTDLHDIAEHVDRGDPLSGHVSLDDRRDMAAYARLCEEFGWRHLDIERFVVQDTYRIGGTYDRRSVSYDPRTLCPVCDAPIIEGDLERAPKPKVLDLKTGRVDYGGGKMRQQLAVYANSDDYDPVTGARSPHEVCTHRGFIVHVPAGRGEAFLYAVDLVRGWQDVGLSAAVREHRRESQGALVLLADPLALDEVPS